MEYRPAAWMTELVEGVAGCMDAHSPIGALGWRYHEEEDLLELVVYPTPIQLVGGEHDGAIVIPGFSLDVLALQAVFERVTALHWHAHDVGPDDEEHDAQQDQDLDDAEREDDDTSGDLGPAGPAADALLDDALLSADGDAGIAADDDAILIDHRSFLLTWGPCRANAA